MQPGVRLQCRAYLAHNNTAACPSCVAGIVVDCQGQRPEESWQQRDQRRQSTLLTEPMNIEVFLSVSHLAELQPRYAVHLKYKSMLTMDSNETS